jgi:HPt (histidine-containing phosphotransfer) domain-containing protein
MVRSYLDAEPPLLADMAPQGRQASMDSRMVSRLIDADPGLVGQMVQLFLQLAPERMAKLNDAVGRGDLSLVRAELWKLRGAASSIAAAEVAETAANLDEAVTRQDASALRDGLLALDAQIREVGRKAAAAGATR